MTRAIPAHVRQEIVERVLRGEPVPQIMRATGVRRSLVYEIRGDTLAGNPPPSGEAGVEARHERPPREAPRPTTVEREQSPPEPQRVAVAKLPSPDVSIPEPEPESDAEPVPEDAKLEWHLGIRTFEQEALMGGLAYVPIQPLEAGYEAKVIEWMRQGGGAWYLLPPDVRLYRFALCPGYLPYEEARDDWLLNGFRDGLPD